MQGFHLIRDSILVKGFYKGSENAGLIPRGSIYTIYGIRPPKKHPCFGFGDLIP